MVDPIKISLDFYRRNVISINAKQLDDVLRVVEISCTSNGKKVILDSATTTAFLRYKKPDGYYVLENPDITSDGVIKLILKQSMLSEVGRCIADIMLINSTDVDINNIENIEDIINSETLDGVGVISTMSFYVNVEATAIDHSKLAGVYKKDDFVDIVSKLAATDNYAKSKEQERQVSENARVKAEESRIKAESGRENRVESFISDSTKTINDSVAEYSTKMETSLSELNEIMDSVNVEMTDIKNDFEETVNDVNNAKDLAIYWTGKAETATNNANIATENAQTATTNANAKTEEMDALMKDINQTIGGVINDNTSSESTTYSSQKIDTTISNFSNSNLLINGDFQIWQRGTSFTNEDSNGSYSGNGLYSADRWYFIHTSSAHPSMTLSIDKIENGISITSSFNAILKQKMETPLKEESYVISAKINGEVQTLQITGGNYIENDYLFYEMDEYETVGIKLPIGTTTIEWVKLEQGSMVTSFVPRTYIEELMICQRYYYVLPYSQYTVGFAYDKQRCYLHSEWAANNMRNNKTIINKTGHVTICHSGTVGIAVEVSSMSWEYGAINIFVKSDICIHQAAYMYYNSATGYIAIDAEIY